MKKLSKSSFIKYFKKLFTCVLVLIFVQSPAQDLKREQVKRLQRSIFIYNLAEQVSGWPEFKSSKTFNIGVLGPDRSLIDLKSLSERRNIQSKPVEVIRFNQLKDVSGIHLLYVNNKYNFDIQYLLEKIKNQHILLITEDYNYHTSMINMISVDNSFEYEINSNLIGTEGFTIAKSLERYAVSSSQKWKSLYKSTEESLNTIKEIEAKQQKLLKDKEKRIISQDELIKRQKGTLDTTLRTVYNKNRSIERLSNENELQHEKYNDKIQIEKELEKNIQDQIAFIRYQQKKIETSELKIKKQEGYLNNQTKEIENKDAILGKKIVEINAQKKVNLLLIVLVIIFLLTVLYIFRSNFLIKKLNKTLDEKNSSIEQQAVMLEAKNSKLEQFNYIATHDLKVPISNLEGYYLFLKEDLKTEDEDLLDTIFWIGKSIEQSKLMISDLIQIAKSETAIIHYENLSFETIFRDIIDSMQQEINKHNAEVIFDFDACPNVIYGKVELKSILQNLVSNSLKYHSPNRNPIIIVKSYIDTNFASLTVSDNGLGINLETHAEDLFGVFKRIHTNEEGSGIGLYMIKNIIESTGGKIEVSSEPDVGTEFRVYFKLR